MKVYFYTLSLKLSVRDFYELMLNHLGTRSLLSSSSTPAFAFSSRETFIPNRPNNSTSYSFQDLNLNRVRVLSTLCAARRRVRNEEDDEEEEYGHNEEIALLETYSQNARAEALIVHAIVDQQDVEVLIFKVIFFFLSNL